MDKDDTSSPGEFTPRIGRVARRSLAGQGITRYEPLTTTDTAQLLQIHGVGPKTIRILGEELAARGLSFGGAEAASPHAADSRARASQVDRAP